MTRRKATTTPTTVESPSTTPSESPVRAADGTFLPGVSGNPNGRPKGKKNQITELKQDLEIAIRQNLNSQKIQAIVESMYKSALEGNVGAAKLLLDKVLSNARESDDAQESGGGLRIIIENATLDVTQQNQRIIDSTAEEISP